MKIGRVFARDGEPGEAAGELARRHDQHRHQQIERAAASFKRAPEKDRGREQIKHPNRARLNH